MPAIVPIVEGHAEVQSLPVLLRRLVSDQGTHDVQIARPFRVKRYSVVRPNELERAIQQAVADRSEAAAVMVVLDSDDDCPARLGSELLARAKIATQLPVAVILAHRELECWFLGAKESLRGQRGIKDDSEAPPNPEGIRGAKERLTENMLGGRRYVEVDDQPAFAEAMDLELAKLRCPSFAKLTRDFLNLVGSLNAGRTPREQAAL